MIELGATVIGVALIAYFIAILIKADLDGIGIPNTSEFI